MYKNNLEQSAGSLGNNVESDEPVVLRGHTGEIVNVIDLIEDQQVKRLGEGIDGLQIYVDKVMKTIEI